MSKLWINKYGQLEEPIFNKQEINIYLWELINNKITLHTISNYSIIDNKAWYILNDDVISINLKSFNTFKHNSNNVMYGEIELSYVRYYSHDKKAINKKDIKTFVTGYYSSFINRYKDKIKAIK